MFGLFSSGISVKAVQKGKYLDKAIEKSADEFFDCRLHNKPRKALVGLWLVFFEDERFIYWGNPSFNGIFSDKRVLKALYKTEKNKVEQRFPQYKKDFYSIEIKQKIRELIHNYESLKDGVLFRDFYLNENYKIGIENGIFEIIAAAEVTYTAAPYSDHPHEEKQKRSYNIKLKTENLELIEIK